METLQNITLIDPSILIFFAIILVFLYIDRKMERMQERSDKRLDKLIEMHLESLQKKNKETFRWKG